MLLELRIKNFVLIEEANLSLEEGFTVFSGETGAGKSLLIKALRALLGERGGSNFIKPGAPLAEISAVLRESEILPERLKEMGYQPEEEIHIRRIIQPQKQRCFLNGAPISLFELTQLTKDLIFLTSQHEYYSFLQRENQLKFLDALLGHSETMKKYQDLYKAYLELQRKLSELNKKISEALQRKDYLFFQISEIEELNPDPEEEEKLRVQRERLKNFQLFQELKMGLKQALEESKTNLSLAINYLSRLLPFEPNLKGREKVLQEFYYELSELEREIRSWEGDWPEDERDLDFIEARLAKYERLKRKYGRDALGLKKLKEDIKKELSLLETGEEELESLEREKEKIEKELLDLALVLSEQRKKGSKILVDLIKKELRELGMEKVEFEIQVNSKAPIPESLTSTGIDDIEFLFSSNPGIPLRPLEKVVSGGELSRIFLSLRSLQSLKKVSSSQGVLIFDEIDTGIGGETAFKVGEKLKRLSQSFQIICITHLPQIACFADHHFLVEKDPRDQETLTFIRELKGEERLRELARMLGDKENLELAKNYLKSLNTF